MCPEAGGQGKGDSDLRKNRMWSIVKMAWSVEGADRDDACFRVFDAFFGNCKNMDLGFERFGEA